MQCLRLLCWLKYKSGENSARLPEENVLIMPHSMWQWGAWDIIIAQTAGQQEHKHAQHAGATWPESSQSYHGVVSQGCGDNDVHLPGMFWGVNEIVFVESPGQDQAYNGHSIDTSQFYIIFLVSMIFTNNDGIWGSRVHVSTISGSRSFQKSSSFCSPSLFLKSIR